ncbi:MAG: WG repeat-containing protein [Azoarcus sp.]|nr:WG repeat-containing protein [Azoarcus sp.]
MIPPRFEFVSGVFANGLTSVKENGKYGDINAKGQTVAVSATLPALPPAIPKCGEGQVV